MKNYLWLEYIIFFVINKVVTYDTDNPHFESDIKKILLFSKFDEKTERNASKYNSQACICWSYIFC